jgi:hypothetical protein
MNFRKLFLLPLSLALAAAGALADGDAKNILDIWWGDVPAAAEELLQTRPEIWNFGFRPYGSASFWLWTDPLQQRNILAGDAPEGKNFTAVSASCNADGFNILLYTVEAAMQGAIAKTNDLPKGRAEIYILPGDTDTRDMIPYYQFEIVANPDNEIVNYPWAVEDRRYRNPTPYMSLNSRRLNNGWLHVISIPWEPFWDKLPFLDRADNFWRLGVIRFGVHATWGGVVHEASRFGYIRFPRFTDAQKTEIRKRLLERAWTRYLSLRNTPTYNASRSWGAPWPRFDKFIVEDEAAHPRTHVHYTQDPDFSPILADLEKERNGLAAGIARFAEMPTEEQEAFFAKAADMLFNFRYDVEKAYTKFLNARLFED